MGAAVPKQYLELDGTPILVLTLERFQEHSEIDEIVLTVPPGDDDRWRCDIVERFRIDKVTHVVAGGRTRQESVFNGLTTIESAEVVAIHDGVRPFVSARVISGTIDAALLHGAALACVPVNETVKRTRGPYLETVPRADLWLAHTPQTFRLDLIREAHQRALADGFDGTDDASLVERLGHPIVVVEDSPNNLKITTQADLDWARFLSVQVHRR